MKLTKVPYPNLDEMGYKISRRYYPILIFPYTRLLKPSDSEFINDFDWINVRRGDGCLNHYCTREHWRNIIRLIDYDILQNSIEPLESIFPPR